MVTGDGVTSRGQVLARSTDGASTFLGERAEGEGTGAARGDVLGDFSWVQFSDAVGSKVSSSE